MARLDAGAGRFGEAERPLRGGNCPQLRTVAGLSDAVPIVGGTESNNPGGVGLFREAAAEFFQAEREFPPAACPHEMTATDCTCGT
jgi:hypothetical protein